MSGPRPIPTHLKVLRGNPSHRPLRDEPQPLVPDDCPDPPPFITGYAADEWWRVGVELHRLGLLTIIDTGPLAAYCQAFARWRTAEETLAKIAANDPQMHGLMIRREHSAMVNPLVIIARKAAADMVRYSSEFGLTPAARARIAAGVADNTQSKFAGLLAG